MMKRKIEHIVILGSGNVATHLAVNLHNSGYIVDQIYSRTKDNAQQLAKQVQALFSNNPEEILDSADLYIIAVSDSYINEIAALPQLKNKFVVHTAGSVDMNILAANSSEYGVFYPFQTFSKSKIINFKKVPVLVEAASDDLKIVLKQLAESLSNVVIEADSQKRAMLHIAAVFACNFTNHMYTLANQLLNENNLSFELMMPLIQETAEKVKYLEPADAQTGPAIRKDQSTISKHLDFLEDKKSLQTVYELLTKSIQKA